MDEDYVRALGYGLPPTGGEGYRHRPVDDDSYRVEVDPRRDSVSAVRGLQRLKQRQRCRNRVAAGPSGCPRPLRGEETQDRLSFLVSDAIVVSFIAAIASVRARCSIASVTLSPVEGHSPPTAGKDGAKPDRFGRRLQLRSALRAFTLHDEAGLVQRREDPPDHDRRSPERRGNLGRSMHRAGRKREVREHSEAQAKSSILRHTMETTTKARKEGKGKKRRENKTFRGILFSFPLPSSLHLFSARLRE